ncbi:MAG TPA: hypothetical protein VGO52_19895 [Hyphomonadaceae bacterium]|nr:hypothetical protein [Hyphomonadaceae bacterium]
MSLMAIILWALHALSPMRRPQESARHLLTTLLHHLSDPRWPAWLEANPDDPSGFPTFEGMLDDLDTAIDILIYQKARALLCLPQASWKRPRKLPLQRRRSRSFAELFVRLEACALRFGDIERLAQRRAEKLARLLEPSEIRLDEPAHAALISEATSRGERNAATSPIILFCFTAPSRLLAQRAGLRVRAPP